MYLKFIRYIIIGITVIFLIGCGGATNNEDPLIENNESKNTTVAEDKNDTSEDLAKLEAEKLEAEKLRFSKSTIAFLNLPENNSTTNLSQAIIFIGEANTTLIINKADGGEIRSLFPKSAELNISVSLELGENNFTISAINEAGNTNTPLNLKIERVPFSLFETAFNPTDFNDSNPDLNITYSQAPNGDLNATLPFGETTFVVPDVNNTQPLENYTTKTIATYLDQNGTEISSEPVNGGDVLIIPTDGRVRVDAKTTPVDNADTQVSTSVLGVNVGAEIILDSPTVVNVTYTTGTDPFGNPVVIPTGTISSSDQLIEYIVVNGKKIDINEYFYDFDLIGEAFSGTTLNIDIKTKGNDVLENYPILDSPSDFSGLNLIDLGPDSAYDGVITDPDNGVVDAVFSYDDGTSDEHYTNGVVSTGAHVKGTKVTVSVTDRNGNISPDKILTF